MSLLRLILREIVFRKLNFLLAVFAVAVAVGCVLGQLVILGQHDRRSEEILAAYESEYRRELADLEDDIRVATKNLGFNLVIFPKDVDLTHFSSKGYIEETMPEEYVQRLAKAPLVSINHLLPVLEKRVFVPEIELEIMLRGMIGEVPIASQAKKKPFLEPVPRGKITLGHQLRRLLEHKAGAERRDLNPGDQVTLLGRAFVIHKVQPKQLGPEDTIAWIHLKDAQEVFGKKGRINALYALECNCEAGRLGQIRAEIASVLPETQVEEFETKATARAEARTRTARAKAALLEQAAKEREDLRGQKEEFLSLLIPLITLAALLWLGFLALGNVLQRRGEIGLFRALGWRSRHLVGLVLGRALIVGVAGALLGLLAAVMGARLLGEDYGWLVEGGLVPWMALAGAPLACLVAAWVPALIAIRQDPATILQRELT